jgi:hypothetical protein
MPLVLEGSFLRGRTGQLVVKELAIVSGSNGCRQMQTYHFKAPHPSWLLPKPIQRTNCWVTCKLHSISWDTGNIAYDLMPDLLRDSVSGEDFIVTKGSEKAAFFSEIIGRTVVDLATLECPKAENIHMSSPYICGFGHVTHCALNKAVKYAKWLTCKHRNGGR